MTTWKISGANAGTGIEVKIVVEAENETDAIRTARAQGVLVSAIKKIASVAVESVHPAMPEVAAVATPLNYEAPSSAGSRLPVQVQASATPDILPGETLMLQNFDVVVTSARLIAGGTTYAVSNIGAVRVVASLGSHSCVALSSRTVN